MESEGVVIGGAFGVGGVGVEKGTDGDEEVGTVDGDVDEKLHLI